MRVSWESVSVEVNVIRGWLGHAEAAALSAAELEERLQEQSREVFRQLFADYLELRARDEPRLSPVVNAHGVAHRTVEAVTPAR